jgi:hypothetical protein
MRTHSLSSIQKGSSQNAEIKKEHKGNSLSISI